MDNQLAYIFFERFLLFLLFLKQQESQKPPTFSNGNKYVGGWKDGKKHGIGTDYDRKTGFRSEYEFQDGEIIEFLRVY